MEPRPNILFLPPSTIEDAPALTSQQPEEGSLTETFLPDERYLTRLSPQDVEMAAIYGHDQTAFNRQCEEICFALLEILARTGGNPGRLRDAFRPCSDLLLSASKKEKGPLDVEFIKNCVLETLTDSPTEIFFSFLGYFRHLLAAAAPQREKAWQDFGVNRYLDEDRPLPTPLTPQRYQPSVTRAKASGVFGAYIAYLEQKQRSGLQKGLDEKRLTLERVESEMDKNRARNKTLRKFQIIKSFAGNVICFGEVDDWSTMLNFMVPKELYAAIYKHMDEIFLSFFGNTLPSAQECLTNIFRIQFWFIHVMPYYRGSAAIMNWFRYAMTIYYNYRARQAGVPMLPVVPSRRDYFPDLEALICCTDERQFVDKSLRDIYCMDFTDERK